MIRGSNLTTAEYMDANGWYAPDGKAHLTQAGYEGISNLSMQALQSALANYSNSSYGNETNQTQLPICNIADVNKDGVVNLNDLSLVGANWNKVGSNIADVNLDEVVNLNDLALVGANWGKTTGNCTYPDVTKALIAIPLSTLTSSVTTKKTKLECNNYYNSAVKSCKSEKITSMAFCNKIKDRLQRSSCLANVNTDYSSCLDSAQKTKQGCLNVAKR
jgi:hypothetical protein